jgi:hypothetical protein
MKETNKERQREENKYKVEGRRLKEVIKEGRKEGKRN